MATLDIAALVGPWERALREAFLSAVYASRERVRIADIAALLERGEVSRAAEAVGLDAALFRDLDVAIQSAFDAGGRAAVSGLPALREPGGYMLRAVFDARNARAEAWIKDHSSTLIAEIVEDQRAAVRAHLTAGLEAGQNPRAVATGLAGKIDPRSRQREGGILGLTSQQEGWARNYAAELSSADPAALARKLRDKRFDATVKKAIRLGEPIPADAQRRMVEAYRNRALKHRAETVARTEAMASLNQSQIEAMQQQIDAGRVQEREVVKIWRSSHDTRVRESHAAMDKQTVAFRAPFVTPSGARIDHPGQPGAPASEVVNCRCWMQVKVDFLARAK